MKAWKFDPATKSLSLEDVDASPPRRGAVSVRVRAAMVLSYMREVLYGGRATTFPDRPFVPGTDAVGIVEAVGDGVYHLKVGQSVSLQPYAVANEQFVAAAEILMGHTFRIGEAAARLQDDWVDGAFAEVVEWPASLATPLDALPDAPPERALGLAKCVVPYGGLRRIGVAAGETVAINGASGFYGSAGVLVALSLGAARVVALGRSLSALEAVCAAAGERAVPVVLSDDLEKNIGLIRAAAGEPLDAALDMVGATSPVSTGSVLRSLRRGGRLAMMGSCPEPLEIGFGEILANNWTIAGQFMYPQNSVRELAGLAAGNQLDISAIDVAAFALGDLEAAMDHAEKRKGLSMTCILPD